MSKIITIKKVNVDQLGHETSFDLNIETDIDGSTVIESSMPEADLIALIDNHKANDSWVNPVKVIPPSPAQLAKAALLEKLGITAEEAALLLS
jgi:hypothetical protein